MLAAPGEALAESEDLAPARRSLPSLKARISEDWCHYIFNQNLIPNLGVIMYSDTAKIVLSCALSVIGGEEPEVVVRPQETAFVSFHTAVKFIELQGLNDHDDKSLCLPIADTLWNEARTLSYRATTMPSLRTDKEVRTAIRSIDFNKRVYLKKAHEMLAIDQDMYLIQQGTPSTEIEHFTRNNAILKLQIRKHELEKELVQKGRNIFRSTGALNMMIEAELNKN